MDKRKAEPWHLQTTLDCVQKGGNRKSVLNNNFSSIRTTPVFMHPQIYHLILVNLKGDQTIHSIHSIHFSPSILIFSPNNFKKKSYPTFSTTFFGSQVRIENPGPETLLSEIARVKQGSALSLSE